MAAGVGCRCADSKTNWQRDVAAVDRMRQHCPRGRALGRGQVAGPHAPYLPYWLPPIRRRFGASIYFGDFETKFSPARQREKGREKGRAIG